MKKALRLFLKFFIPGFVVFFFWVLTTNNFFIVIGVGLPDAIIIGILFLLVDLFIVKETNINFRAFIRVGVFILLFIIITAVHMLLEDGEIIRPLKQIFKTNKPMELKDFF